MAKAFDLLIPVRQRREISGVCRLSDDVKLAAERPEDVFALELTANVLNAAGVNARVLAGDDSSATIRAVRNAAIAHAEGYRLTVAAKSIRVEARTAAGVFYGMATLRELIRAGGKRLRCTVIDDEPAFARRAVYHDLARGKVPRLKTLLTLVERLAEWKINELQLYIENAFAFRKHPDISKGYSPLTPRDILALQRHCRRYHVRLVPSLASFGHLEKVLCLPGYRHLSELPNGGTLCPADPGSIRFVDDLYSEYLPLHEDGDFNVCCDETWDLGRGRSAARAAKVGVGRVYLDFLLKIRRLCEKYGKRMHAWSDIVLDHPELLGDVPRDIVMLNWGYEADDTRMHRTREIAEAGLPLMVCPGTSAWNTLAGRWPNAVANIRNFAAQGVKYGAEGVLNTDWGDNGHRQFLAISLMGFAFGAAESWSPGKADVKNFPRNFALHGFGDRTGAVGDAIEALGCAYLKYTERANAEAMYFNLTEPLVPDGYVRQRTVDRHTPAQLDALLASLPAPGVWDIAARDEFDALTMREFALTARTYEVYAARSRVAWDLGLGEPVPTKRLTALADDIDGLAERFSQLWLARNKPSRLRDNMRLFRAAAGEARGVARRRASNPRPA